MPIFIAVEERISSEDKKDYLTELKQKFFPLGIFSINTLVAIATIHLSRMIDLY